MHADLREANISGQVDFRIEGIYTQISPIGSWEYRLSLFRAQKMNLRARIRDWRVLCTELMFEAQDHFDTRAGTLFHCSDKLRSILLFSYLLPHHTQVHLPVSLGKWLLSFSDGVCQVQFSVLFSPLYIVSSSNLGCGQSLFHSQLNL